MDSSEKLVVLYQQMYELTEPECAANCRLPRTCCSPEYCDMAEENAQEWGFDIIPLQQRADGLRFMGPTGCVLPPHIRPICTMHTCDVNAFGCKTRPKLDQEWTEKYFDLRNKIGELEYERSEQT